MVLVTSVNGAFSFFFSHVTSEEPETWKQRKQLWKLENYLRATRRL